MNRIVLEMEKMDVQELEYKADIRIKFASINDKTGGYDDDTHSVIYEPFFREMEGDWWPQQNSPIETRFDYNRDAWVLSHRSTGAQIAAVEHESGIELLVTGIAVSLASTAIVGFVKWAWNKWKKIRSSLPDRIEPSLQTEVVTEKFPDGRIRRTQRFEYRGPLDSELVGQLVNHSFQLLPGGQ